MNTYIITEKQCLNSFRTGERIEAPNLAYAKIAASKAQVFRGTVLTIETESGDEICYKENGKWVNFAEE